MDQSIALAGRGRGAVEPNPMVGCVIVKDSRVIGKGFHQKFGGPHAEPNALGDCSESPRGATVYVNLEPCCHTNKKTPPCVPQLIAAGVGRVVIGCVDPNPAVAGVGVETLRAAGIEVTVGVREAESRQLNAAFFAVQTLKRPYVTLKWAQTADGKVAGPGGRRLQISGEPALRASHFLRSRSDAILVGIRTALWDDPLLTIRLAGPHRPLMRAVLDSSIRLPAVSRLVSTANEHATHLFCTRRPEDAAQAQRAMRMELAGVQIHSLPADASGRVALQNVLRLLAEELHVTHLVVEGGPAVHESFLRENFADRAWLVRSPTRIEASDAPDAASMPAGFDTIAAVTLGTDRLTEYLNRHSSVYFASLPSVDIEDLSTPSQFANP